MAGSSGGPSSKSTNLNPPQFNPPGGLRSSVPKPAEKNCWRTPPKPSSKPLPTAGGKTPSLASKPLLLFARIVPTFVSMLAHSTYPSFPPPPQGTTPHLEQRRAGEASRIYLRKPPHLHPLQSTLLCCPPGQAAEMGRASGCLSLPTLFLLSTHPFFLLLRSPSRERL